MSSPETEIIQIAMSETEAGMIAERLRNQGIDVWLRPQGVGFLGNPLRPVEVIVLKEDVACAQDILQEPWVDDLLDAKPKRQPPLSDDGELK